MSRYEKVDFLMYELQNGFRMALKPFNSPPPLPPTWWWWLGGGGGLVVMVVVGCYPSVLNPQSSVLNPQSSILNPQSSVLKFLFSSNPFCTTDIVRYYKMMLNIV